MQHYGIGRRWLLYSRTEQGENHLTIEEHLLLEDALRDGWIGDAPKGI